MNTVNKFEEKRLLDLATKFQLSQLHVLSDLAGMHADFPIWPLVITLQEELTKEGYRLQHPDYVATCVKTDDYVAALWNSQGGLQRGRCRTTDSR